MRTGFAAAGEGPAYVNRPPLAPRRADRLNAYEKMRDSRDLVRLRGFEPPQPFRITRPSTLRVYQFRHRRPYAIDSRGALRDLLPSEKGATLTNVCSHPGVKVARDC